MTRDTAVPDPARHQIVTMLELQDDMNRRVHPDWRSQDFAWYRAVWIECAELLDHYGWKWWKKQKPDLDQVKLELVDIWHFGLSILLLGSDSLEQIAAEIAEGLGEGSSSGDFRTDLEDFTLITLQTKAFSVAAFARLLDGVGMGFEELYGRYVGKNVLNFFRQDNGYQEGTYTKSWQGREDNEHLVEIVERLDVWRDDFKDELYRELSLRYRREVSA